jgi:omega-amidase
VANWPAPRQVAWETLLAARAIENLSYVAGVNRVGADGNGFAFDGGTSAFGPAGEQLLLARGQVGVYVVELDAAALAAHRERFPAWRDADAFTLG